MSSLEYKLIKHKETITFISPVYEYEICQDGKWVKATKPEYVRNWNSKNKEDMAQFTETVLYLFF